MALPGTHVLRCKRRSPRQGARDTGEYSPGRGGRESFKKEWWSVTLRRVVSVIEKEIRWPKLKEQGASEKAEAAGSTLKSISLY